MAGPAFVDYPSGVAMHVVGFLASRIWDSGSFTWRMRGLLASSILSLHLGAAEVADTADLAVFAD
jgi:hypothetical protein